MSDADSRRIAAYYDALAARHGVAPEAVDASSQASLDVRYRVLGDVADLAGKRVLDVGCGFGGLGAELLTRFPEVDYTGIDVSERLVAEGRRAHPGLRLEVADVLELAGESRWDAVLAQGIFYLLGEGAEEKSHRRIEAMWRLADECVAFTTLSAWATAGTESSEYRADPGLLLDYCRTLTPRLVLRHDYHPGDVALYLYRA